MPSNYFHRIIILFLIASFLLAGFGFSKPVKASEYIGLEDYLAYFYNRYSEHFDVNGFIFKTPGYNVSEFRPPESAREILSLALYYEYRALKGEKSARTILGEALLKAEAELNSRDPKTQSFSDAWAEMVTLSLLDRIPFLIAPDSETEIYKNIIGRAKDGILAPDTSNRAALGAVYWQVIVNNLFNKNLITEEQKAEFDSLIKTKITAVLKNDVDQYFWYREGKAMQFSPHYHMVAALAFTCYGELTDDMEFLLAGREMTDNLRAVTFQNGMVEARLAGRPAGLGAQFYLGAGLLNYKFGYPDFATYFNYALGDKFFSDPAYNNRLEYHSTVKNTAPNFHDDTSFSNLAELALLTPSLASVKFEYTSAMANIPPKTSEGKIEIINKGNYLEFNDLKIWQDKSGDATTVLNLASSQTQVLGVSISRLAYGHYRLAFDEEDDQRQSFKNELARLLPAEFKKLNAQNIETLFLAYLYGGYNLDEIMDTIENGPRAVHPTIPASRWRSSKNYQKYLADKGN
jgi:hypothetical protein